MLTVLLYGHLAKAFGRRHRYAVRNPAEAIRALSANKKGFREYLAKHSAPGYRVLVGKEPREFETLGYPADDVIKIVPVIAGAGRGLGQVILGAVLIVVSYFFPPAWGAFGSFVASVGTSMVLGGVAQMLTPVPKAAKDKQQPDNLPSFIFNGAVNTTAQGNPVPVCYGRLIVGSQVISAGLSANPA